MGEFNGFSKDGLAFLTTLGTKDKAWFDENRKTYQAEVVAPAKAFVTDLGGELRARISDAIEAQPKTNGSIAPINNDLRFNPDASPYKDHLMFRFWEGPVKKTSAMLMIRLHPTDGIGFASGMGFADVGRWRDTVASDDTGQGIADAVDAAVKVTKADVAGDELKRVPKPFDAEHPRGDLLRKKGLQVRYIEKTPKAAVIGSADFVEWCADRLDPLADIHRWLVANMV